MMMTSKTITECCDCEWTTIIIRRRDYHDDERHEQERKEGFVSLFFVLQTFNFHSVAADDENESRKLRHDIYS